jgi:hypothetical protein
MLSPNVKRKKEYHRETDAPLVPVPQRAAARTAERKIHAAQECEQEDEDGEAGEERNAWAAAEKPFADSIIRSIVKEAQRRRGEQFPGITAVRADRIRANVHSWASAARRQQMCTGAGPFGTHAPHGLCRGRFHPELFFEKGAVQFAHWPTHKRNNDPSELIRSRCKSDDNATFIEWMSVSGRFLYSCCHAIETAQELTR